MDGIAEASSVVEGEGDGGGEAVSKMYRSQVQMGMEGKKGGQLRRLFDASSDGSKRGAFTFCSPLLL